ncbi:MAG: hypothetical protein ABEJ30_06405 [Halorientalis sp.]
MRRTLTLAVVAVTVLSLLPLATAGATQEMSTLEVVVVNEQGDPVAGATLAVSWDGGNTTETTRANGHALVDVPTGSDVEIDIRSDQYVRNTP